MKPEAEIESADVTSGIKWGRGRRMIRYGMRQFGFFVMLAVLTLCVLAGKGTSDKTGDKVQIALPLTGLACAVAEGQGVQYFGRFLLMEVLLHGSKRGLGEMELNQRPNGGYHGFPSGHTTAAVFGASALVQGCLRGNKSAQAVTLVAAGFVATSRIENYAHTVLQTVAGALLGWFVQSASLVAFDRAFGRICRGIGGGLRAGFGLCAGFVRRALRLRR